MREQKTKTRKECLQLIWPIALGYHGVISVFLYALSFYQIALSNVEGFFFHGRITKSKQSRHNKIRIASF